ncbi:MAG: hypothetical protein JWN86_210 [Planctomycetota bacterium]|nr:hypothetical protein [Planctomycetota bacterium]
MQRIRISTLMLLVVIAALTIGLFVEKRRSAVMQVQLQAREAEARLREQYAHALVARSQARVRKAQAAEYPTKATAPPSR